MPFVPGATPAQRGFPALYPHFYWAPHPQPHPTVSPATFFDLAAMPASQLDAAAALRMSGFPLPGTMHEGWQPPAWPPAGPLIGAPTYVDPMGSVRSGQTHALFPTPYGSAMGLPTPSSGHGAAILQTSPFGAIPLLHPYLMPNPGNAAEPWLLWDIRHPPSTARRVAARAVVVGAQDKFKDTATHPPVPRVHIAYSTNTVNLLNYWGPIVIDKGEGGTVSIGDIIEGLYEYFQQPLLQHEAAVIERDFPDVWRQVTQAFRKRCRDHYWIPEVEWARGMRRVDCLGERHMFWGMWVTHNANGTFQLNLGLVPKKQNYLVPRLVSTRRR
ncbi:hypothetical protein C8T65DRAFT_671175 [Cerioporus squamosus]|nr:hypothetical protein C8T65DRAFT_671175 [Cerioporus squamosus]